MPHSRNSQKICFSRLRTDYHLIDGAGSYCHHRGLQHLALRLFWQHDATLRYCLCGKALHQHAVKQGEEFSEGLQVRTKMGNEHILLLSNNVLTIVTTE